MKTYLLNRVENIVAKGEIALWPQCFQKLSAAERQNGSAGGKE